MRNDKFLVGILVFIGLLVVAALALFVTGQTSQDYLSGGDPETAVHNYTLAVTRGDFDRAYSYLASGEGKPTAAEFQTFFTQGDFMRDTGLRIEGSDIVEDEAIVEVTIIQTPSGLFQTAWDRPDTAILRLESGEWRIVSMPWPFWEFDWTTAPPTPRP